MTVKIGIIGSGQIAGFHVEALRKTDAAIVAIADVNEEMGRALAARTNARYIGDYHKLLDDPAVDVVFIATPNSTHYQLACDALDAGKDVFCEKPMTTRPERSAELVAKVQAHPRQIFHVGYMKRYNQGFRLVQELLPEIGDLVSAHVRVMVNYRNFTGESWYQQPSASGGGVLEHSGSHLLDVSRVLFGDPLQVDSRVRYVPGMEGLDMLSMTLMDMANGLTMYFSTVGVPIARLGHTQQGWEETVEVIGMRGRVLLSSPNWQGSLPCVVKLQLDEDNQVRTIYPDPVSQWETQMRAFLENVALRRQGHADVLDGYKVDEIIASIYESGRRRAPVTIEWKC